MNDTIDKPLFNEWISIVGIGAVLRELETIANHYAMNDKRYVKVQNRITLASIEANSLERNRP